MTQVIHPGDLPEADDTEPVDLFTDLANRVEQFLQAVVDGDPPNFPDMHTAVVQLRLLGHNAQPTGMDRVR